MAKDKKGFILYADLINVNYKFNTDYGLSYLNTEQFNKIDNSLSTLRRLKEISGEEYHLLRSIFKHQYYNYSKIRELISLEPRKIAQKFIGRKKIRDFIFKRDKFKCLKCGSKCNLTIDHIEPIFTGGENKLSNLQTLCKSCNSSKSSTYKDYR